MNLIRTRGRVIVHAVITAVVALLTATAVAACTPAAHPTHFGDCPAGQHWVQQGQQWECAR